MWSLIKSVPLVQLGEMTAACLVYRMHVLPPPNHCLLDCACVSAAYFGWYPRHCQDPSRQCSDACGRHSFPGQYISARCLRRPPSIRHDKVQDEIEAHDHNTLHEGKRNKKAGALTEASDSVDTVIGITPASAVVANVMPVIAPVAYATVEVTRALELSRYSCSAKFWQRSSNFKV